MRTTDLKHDPGTGIDAPDEVTWRRALVVGLVAYVVSRLCVAAGAGVRASQLVVDGTADGGERPRNAVSLIVDVFTSWDGLWYLEIVRQGYPRSIPPGITYFQEEARAAFFPLYPMVVRAVDVVFPGGDTFAALFVNLVLGAVAVVLVGLMAKRLAGTTAAMHSMVLFAVFPGSFVLSFAYSEAMLVVLAAGCLLLLLDERWVLAGLVAALATATRPNGIALVAACAVAAFIAIRARRDWSSLAAPALSPLGFIGFQLFLLAHTDERAPWFRVQREAWAEGTSFGATAARHTFRFINNPLSSPTATLTTLSLGAMLVALWYAWKRPLPVPLTVVAPMFAYVAVVLLLMLVPETVTARPRFLFTAFPLVIPIAAYLPRRDRTTWDLVLVVCGAGLVTLAGLYGVFGAIP